jgi:hypothetical protein
MRTVQPDLLGLELGHKPIDRGFEELLSEQPHG